MFLFLKGFFADFCMSQVRCLVCVVCGIWCELHVGLSLRYVRDFCVLRSLWSVLCAIASLCHVQGRNGLGPNGPP